MDRPWVVTVGYVMYHVRAFLKLLQKNISPILAICDDVSILRFIYMLRSNPEHSEGVDLLTLLTQSLNVCLGTDRLNSAPHGYPCITSNWSRPAYQPCQQ